MRRATIHMDEGVARARITRCCVFVAWAFLLAGRGALAEAEMITPDGRAVRGQVRFSGGRVTVGDATVPVNRLVSLRLSDIPIARTLDQGVSLWSGDVISGTVENAQSGKLRLTSDHFGALELPVASVRAIALMPQRIAELTGADHVEPGAVMTNGDSVSGKLEWINERLVGVDAGRRIVRVPRGRTSLIRVASGNGAGKIPAESTQYVRMNSGDRVSGRLVALSSKALAIQTPYAGRVTIPRSLVREVWSEGGDLVPLSALEPAGVTSTPLFDERFPHGIDRSVVGEFLAVNGHTYERGIGCHSRCEVEFDIGGRYGSLVAEIGIDDGAGGRGGVVFEVYADNRRVFQSPAVRGGQDARVVSVELGRARRVKLVADYGPDGTSWGDHADWCRTVLVRR